MAKTILLSAAVLVVIGGGTAFAAEPAPASETARPEAAPARPETAPAKPESPAWETAPATRRAGFSMGVLLGGAAGQVTGYPNDVNKRGRAEFLADTGAALGGN